MFEIKIDDRAVMGFLARLEHAGQDMSPVMRAIRTELLSQTEANLAAEGGPKWQPLQPSTVAMRTKRGSWPGMIMQESGQLAASYTPGSDAVSAWIGSNKKYAAMQNLGGKTSPRSMIPNKVIAARPSLPITGAGNLQPQAVDAVTRLLIAHFGATATGS